MTLTNYPNGLSSFGIPVLSSGEIPAATGNKFWVDSAVGVAGNPGSFEAPLPTIDSAINKCTASNGDLILAKEGHRETLTTAGAIALDVAGVTVLGLGTGNNRPVITFGSTDNSATFTMSGDNTRLLNIVLVCNDDGLTNGLVVSGNNCIVDIETQDTSAAVEFETAVRLDTADNCKLKLKHNGFTAGNAIVRLVAIDDCDNVKIDIDAYGVVSTAWVNMVDAASTNVSVTGRLYTQGITNFTRDVVDTVTGSTWDAQIFDASAGLSISGGSAAALASDDVGSVSSQVTSVTDALYGTTGIASFPAAAAPANDVSLAEVIRAIYDRQIGDGSSVAVNSFLGKQVLRSTADTITGAAVPIFTVTGRVLLTCIVGKVTTVIGAGATNAKIQFNPTVGTTNDLCINLDIDSDEAGTLYSILGNPSSALSRSESGCVPGMQANGIIAEDGALEFITSADRTGSISFEVWYFPMSAGASVVAI